VALLGAENGSRSENCKPGLQARTANPEDQRMAAGYRMNRTQESKMEIPAQMGFTIFSIEANMPEVPTLSCETCGNSVCGWWRRVEG
jgi:hypothetical protein